MKGFSGFKASPVKQEGPIDKKQLKLQKGEMDGTSVYNPKEDKDMSKKFVKSERIIDLEERAGFLTDNDITNDGSKEDNQRIKTAKKLQHEADIIRNRKGKKSPTKFWQALVPIAAQAVGGMMKKKEE